MDLPNTVLLSQSMALRRQLDITANNLANADTPGFRRESPVFREFVQRAPGVASSRAAQLSFVLDYGLGRDATAGTVTATNGRLDVAIDGPGFLQVQTADGGVAYTRAGRLSVAPDGQLIVSGRPVLSGEGQPIVIDPLLASDLTIANDGTLTSREGPVGQLGLVTFDDPAALLPRGDGLLNAAGLTPQAAENPRLRVGFLEGSNVQPIAETTQLVEISRAYERAQKLSSALDDLRRRAIERLGRLN